MQNMPPDNSNYLLLSQVVKDALNPISEQMRRLSDKVDSLSDDRVTKADIKELRNDLNTDYVRKDVHETVVSELRTMIVQLQTANSALLSKVALSVGVVGTIIGILNALHVFGH